MSRMATPLHLGRSRCGLGWGVDADRTRCLTSQDGPIHFRTELFACDRLAVRSGVALNGRAMLRRHATACFLPLADGPF